MTKNKTFDCVEMKNKIQADMLNASKGLSDKQVLRDSRDKLARSQSPVAKLWRAVSGAQKRVSDASETELIQL